MGAFDVGERGTGRVFSRKEDDRWRMERVLVLEVPELSEGREAREGRWSSNVFRTALRAGRKLKLRVSQGLSGGEEEKKENSPRLKSESELGDSVEDVSKSRGNPAAPGAPLLFRLVMNKFFA